MAAAVTSARPALALAAVPRGGDTPALARGRWRGVWVAPLGQVLLAGAAPAVAAGPAGLAALVALVLARQWWAARHPLPAPGPVPPASTIAVVIPVHDEAASIAEVIAGVPRAALDTRGFRSLVLVVDDGSRDASASIARVAGADRVIQHPARRGLGAALRTGLAAAREAGAAAAVYLDGDGEYDPAELLQVAEPVLAGRADYVLGARFPRAARVMCPARRHGNQAFTLLLRALTGCWLADGQTGFRAFSARALALAEIVHDYNYAQVLTLDLLRKGARLAEVPISYRTRRAGVSFVRYGEYARRVLPAIAYELLAP